MDTGALGLMLVVVNFQKDQVTGAHVKNTDAQRLKPTVHKLG